MDAFDVALMFVRIRPDDDIDFSYRWALDSRPISEGTPIMAVGYPRMRAYFTTPPNYKTQAQLTIKILETCFAKYRKPVATGEIGPPLG